MFTPSRKTAAILAMFMATSTAILAGCSSQDQYYSSDISDAAQVNSDKTILRDDDGREYELKKNSDGTETAVYPNGQSVTFRRDDSGNIDYVSGAAGLLGGLVAGYFLFHGLNPPAGSYYNSSTNRYISNGRPAYMSKSERDNRYNSYMNRYKDKDRSTTVVPPAAANTVNNSSSASSAPKSNATNSSKSNVSSSNNKSSASSSKSSAPSKSGFGSAGARSSAAS